MEDELRLKIEELVSELKETPKDEIIKLSFTAICFNWTLCLICFMHYSYSMDSICITLNNDGNHVVQYPQLLIVFSFSKTIESMCIMFMFFLNRWKAVMMSFFLVLDSSMIGLLQYLFLNSFIHGSCSVDNFFNIFGYIVFILSYICLVLHVVLHHQLIATYTASIL